MLDPYRSIRHTFNKFKQKIPSFNTIEQKSISIIRVIIILIIFILIYSCIQYILKPYDGYDVQPFETIGLGENSDGKAYATLLKFYLQDIKDIYEIGPDRLVISKNVPKSQTISAPLGNLSMQSSFEKEQLDYSISQIGTIGAEGVSLSIGNMLLLMKESRGKWPSTITCSLQRYNSTMILVAILKDNQNNKTMTFKDESIRLTDEQIPSMINDLAFKISLALCKQSKPELYPKKWQTFKYLTKGEDNYSRYIITGDINDLNNSYNMTQLAENTEPGYKGTFELLSNLGFCYLRIGDKDRAKNIFQNISQFRPLDNKLAYRSALGLGFVYIYNNNEKALDYFDKAIKLDHYSYTAWNGKGTILLIMGKYPDALKAFNNATGIDPNYADAWYNKGYALNLLGENASRYDEAITAHEEAIKAYEGAIKVDPVYAKAWYKKGYTLDLLGRLEKDNASRYDEAITAYEEAIKAYESAIKVDPIYAKAWYNKSLDLKMLGRTIEADIALSKANDLGYKG